MLNKEILKRVIAGMFVIAWMTAVFIFSSQDGIQTLNTSGAVIHTIEKTINNDESQVESHTNKIEADTNKTQKYKYSSEVQKIVRKNAHCILYTIGGVVISVFFSALNFNKRKLIVWTSLTGFLYAVSDEIHQRYVPGRTSSVVDVAIDTTGVIIGLIIFMIILKLTTKRIGKTTLRKDKRELL